MALTAASWPSSHLEGVKGQQRSPANGDLLLVPAGVVKGGDSECNAWRQRHRHFRQAEADLNLHDVLSENVHAAGLNSKQA
eukprot:3937458-Rhodomonas_salina.2